MKRIILASGSPRRKELLEQAGVQFSVMISNEQEIFPDDISPEHAAMKLARQKARSVWGSLQNPDDFLIIGADTIVLLDNEILGKPKGEVEATKMLQKLSGRSHHVITGVSLITREQDIGFYEKTEVSFYPLSKDQIKYYIRNYQPFDKAGAYAIQEWIGLVGVKEIHGDFYNVMGLPVSRLLREMDHKSGNIAEADFFK